MEHNDQPEQSRQYAPNPYAAQRTQQPTGQLPEQYHPQASNERFRHPSFLQQSPTASSPAARGASNGQQLYGFNQGAQYAAMQQTGTMAFAQTNQAQEPQRPMQQPSYGYPGNMYAMPQPQAQQQPIPSIYNQVPQYRHQPGAAFETFSTPFGVAQSPQQYYLAGQAGPTSAPAPEPVAQHLPSQYQATGYPQHGHAIPQSYPSTMMEPSQPGPYETYHQQPQPPQYVGEPSGQSADQDLDAYTANVRSIFSHVRDGALRDIGQQLLQISQYLLGNVEMLGLTRDDEALHDDRIRRWDEFNRAWLTALQRQFDMTEEVLHGNQSLREPQSIMTAQTLEHLSRELVRLCDSVEKHGLVDYQMGVAEEEILDLIIRCLSLLDPAAQTATEASRAEESSAAAPRRGR
ncbi:hypothetical protein LTR91_001360 [Friedmanniomyces endolithicus]|uniref:Uncharacterized protein n=1 Tax=Friedmanniomyces endolithicus TaxID=329885 RepID=A0AAN6L269_9PEZI|nr:hypothetical protein LTR57_002519 [Friedmanniomyces endolithicus]KAK0979405.1 hypothetical protein LTS01_012372 [Friedmanniomyces endolithicus]KAK1013763.1 hypothetical protein LTR91_001360 [Friedmanniomyces endolithicus]KAK1036423.1 hypothetical protein LTS16_013714 [Friedmanniomyces endolithicus]